MKTSKLKLLTTGSMLTLLIGSPVWADDTEIFFGTSTASSASAPNIMLILDTSGSMDTNVVSTTAYNPATSYTGNCSSSNVYFKSSGSSLPQCSSGGAVSNTDYDRNRSYGTLSATAFYCSPATETGGSFSTAGYYQGAGIRWTATSVSSNSGSTWSTSYAWQSDLYPEPDNSGTNRRTYVLGAIACTDNNYAGSYPNGVSPTSGTQWTTTSGNSYWSQTSSRTDYIFYSANYLNWYHNHRTSTTSTRLQIMQTAASNLLDSLSGVNVGLMRYDPRGNGGMVVEPVQSVTTGRTPMKTAINGWLAEGNTPLSETLSEAHRYFKGDTVNYGNDSYVCSATGMGGCSSETLTKSTATSRTGGTLTSTNYDSPADYSCQKNYVVFLTDGEPTSDDGANTYIGGLSASDASCSGNGDCLDELSAFMYSHDLRTDVSDTQNVTTYFIGFGSEVAGGAPFAFLDDAAVDGGGHAYAATDLDSLSTTLNDIFLAIRNDSASFTSPSVAVNAFNKTQVLEDLYISVFQPALTTHWPGNLKKYKLRNSKIVGQDTATSAVNTSTGFFETFAQSYWSAAVDGKTTAAGGAANVIPAPGSRKVFTYIGSNPTIGSFPDLSSSVNYSVEDSNSNITDTLLNIGGTGDPAKATLLNWVRGQDTKDDNDNGSTTDARHVMGDPIHSQPSVVIYGNTGSTTTARLNDAVVYIATNDGYLHAIDVESGVELWSFIPQELLGDMVNVYNDAATTTKHYSLDGNIRVLKYDVDGDGVVDTGTGENDRVFLYFSQGRGGDNYYALDVTDKDQPKYMWTLGSSDLGSLVQQSWSTPTLGRVKVNGATQNPQRLVLIFGAGYDSAEDAQGYNSAGNTYGNGLFMVDAVRGTVLWSQTKTVSGAFAKMTHAIPSDVAVLDTNADGWSDRMFVGDMAGQLWRLDITNGNAASSLVAGGVIASVGAKAESTPTTATNRSFYSQPDVAKFVVTDSSNYYNISIGSGDRAHPKLNTTTQDRFYSIRDYRLLPMSQSDYNSYTAMVETDLTTVTGTTAATIGGNGWKLAFGSGEKALAQSVTINGVVLFTSYVPDGATSSCSVSTGSGRAYALDIGTGYKYFTNLYETFATTGLPSQVTVVNEASLVRTDGTTASSSSSSSSSSSTSPTAGTCLSGVSILGSCVEFGTRVKTFWQESGAN